MKDFKTIPPILIISVIAASITIGLGLAFTTYVAAFVQARIGFSNQVATIFLV